MGSIKGRISLAPFLAVVIVIVVVNVGNVVEAQLWPQVPLWEIYVRDHHHLVSYPRNFYKVFFALSSIKLRAQTGNLMAVSYGSTILDPSPVMLDYKNLNKKGGLMRLIFILFHCIEQYQFVNRKSPPPEGNRIHNLWIMRCVFYGCATATAMT